MTQQDKITLERDYEATLDEVWDLWTTKEGIEAWWGPEGFRVEVKSLDLRPGGKLVYAMIADAPEMVAFMKQNGMPTASITSLTYQEVTRPERLVYVNHADFIPGVEPYDVGHVVEFLASTTGVRLRLTLDRMHDEVWTGRMKEGWEMETAKLGRLLASRRAAR